MVTKRPWTCGNGSAMKAWLSSTASMISWMFPLITSMAKPSTMTRWTKASKSWRIKTSSRNPKGLKSSILRNTIYHLPWLKNQTVLPSTSPVIWPPPCTATAPSTLPKTSMWLVRNNPTTSSNSRLFWRKWALTGQMIWFMSALV